MEDALKTLERQLSDALNLDPRNASTLAAAAQIQLVATVAVAQQLGRIAAQLEQAGATGHGHLVVRAT